METTAPSEQTPVELMTQESFDIPPMESPIEEMNYDAFASQRVPLEINDDGETFEVTHKIEGLSNDLLFKYSDMRETLLQPDGKDTKLVTDGAEANLWLWDEICVGVDGYGEEDEALPPNWRELVPDEDKIAVVDALLSIDISPRKTDEPKKRKHIGWGQRGSNTLVLTAVFNGAYVETSHIFRTKTALDVEEYRKLSGTLTLKRRKLLKRGELKVPSQMREKFKLYNRMIERTEGCVAISALQAAALVDDFFGANVQGSEKKLS